MHSTNYKNTLIEIAADSKVAQGKIPPVRGEKKTIANLEYEMLSANPYKYTSDEVKFAIHAIRNEIPKTQYESQRLSFFSKGQPCFRASPLTKTYGWGVHANDKGQIALVACESSEYQQLKADKTLNKVMAMRSKRS